MPKVWEVVIFVSFILLCGFLIIVLVRIVVVIAGLI